MLRRQRSSSPPAPRPKRRGRAAAQRASNSKWLIPCPLFFEPYTNGRRFPPPSLSQELLQMSEQRLMALNSGRDEVEARLRARDSELATARHQLAQLTDLRRGAAACNHRGAVVAVGTRLRDELRPRRGAVAGFDPLDNPACGCAGCGGGGRSGGRSGGRGLLALAAVRPRVAPAPLRALSLRAVVPRPAEYMVGLRCRNVLAVTAIVTRSTMVTCSWHCGYCCPRDRWRRCRCRCGAAQLAAPSRWSGQPSDRPSSEGSACAAR